MTQQEDPDVVARRMSAESIAGDDPTGWFDRLYAAADRGETQVPWDRGEPHRLLVQWAERTATGTGGRAVVVGCGRGDDAAYTASLGFDTTAFDVSPSAIAGARARYPGSPVHYRTADLLDLPADWRRGYRLVVENMTVQSLPPRYRRQATDAVCDLVAPGGTLLTIAFAEDDQPPGPDPSPLDPAGGSSGSRSADNAAEDGPPWPLTRPDLNRFAATGLREVRIDVDRTRSPTWLAEFHRPT